MELIEVILLVLGVIIFAAGFVIPEYKKGTSEVDKNQVEKEVKRLVAKEMEGAKGQLESMLDETVVYAVEKTERSLDKVSNEKIMAVNEYSDTVLEEINRNHKEVMFLYDMLNNKHVDIKNTVRKIEVTAKTTKEAVGQATLQNTIRQSERTVGTETPPKTREFKESQKESHIDAFHQAGSDFTVPDSFKEAKDKLVKDLKREKPADVDFHFSTGEEIGKNNNQKILDMYKAGRTNMVIAKELGLGIGEVKLVIDLFKGN